MEMRKGWKVANCAMWEELLGIQVRPIAMTVDVADTRQAQEDVAVHVVLGDTINLMVDKDHVLKLMQDIMHQKGLGYRPSARGEDMHLSQDHMSGDVKVPCGLDDIPKRPH